MESGYYISDKKLIPLVLATRSLGKESQAYMYRIVFPIALENHCVKIYIIRYVRVIGLKDCVISSENERIV